MPALLSSIKKSLGIIHTGIKIQIINCPDYKIFEQRVLEFSEIEDALISGYVPLMLIDWNVLYKYKGPYSGHFVVVTGSFSF